jgi:hypothetical protein
MNEELMEALLAPIPGERATGRDMRYEREYRAILEARREEDARTPRGVWVREVKQADWGQVERLCSDLLRDKSKDLRVAGWLGEAWVQRHGYAGLAPALLLVAGLCERYWEALHPDIDGDPDVHIAAIEWLNQRLPLVLRQLPVVIHALVPDTRYSWADHVNAEQLATVRLKDAAAPRARCWRQPLRRWRRRRPRWTGSMRCSTRAVAAMRRGSGGSAASSSRSVPLPERRWRDEVRFRCSPLRRHRPRSRRRRPPRRRSPRWRRPRRSRAKPPIASSPRSPTCCESPNRTAPFPLCWITWCDGGRCHWIK